MKKESKGIRLRGLYYRNLGAVLSGFITVAVINIFTPLESIRMVKSFLYKESGWIVYVIVLPLIILISGFVQYLVQRPISAVIKQSITAEKTRKHLEKKAKKNLLNLPVSLAMTTMAMWFVIPTFMMTFFSR